MISFRLKQFGLALCLLASLLVGSASSACICSHHQEKEKSSEISCHGVIHESVEKVVTPLTGNAFEVDCNCFVNQPAPFVVSKSETKKHKADKNAVNSDQAIPELKFSASSAFHIVFPEFDPDLSYSDVLNSLLPARAPPRL